MCENLVGIEIYFNCSENSIILYIIRGIDIEHISFYRVCILKLLTPYTDVNNNAVFRLKILINKIVKKKNV